MPWGRFDDGYAHNRKIRKLSDQAFRLDVAGILWANKYGTDGFIGDDDLPLVCAEVRKPEKTARELADRHRWQRVDGGWMIHDFLAYNPSVEQLRAATEAKTLRQQRWRNNLRDASRDGDVDASVDASTDASRDGAGDASRDGAPPRAQSPTPSPTPFKDSSSSAGADDGSRAAEPERQGPDKPHVPIPGPHSPAGGLPAPIVGDALERQFEVAQRPAAASKRKPRTPPQRFDEFWKAYPRKVGKIAAERAYAKALTAGHDPALIIEGARFYAMERKLQDPQYTKHPATWLNAGCWQDEPDPAYTPPVITGPSEAASAMPRPFAEVRADQLAYGHTPDPGDTLRELEFEPYPDLDFGRIPE